MKRASLRYKNTPAVLKVWQPHRTGPRQSRALQGPQLSNCIIKGFGNVYQGFGNSPPDSPSALNRGYLMTHQSRCKSCIVDVLRHLFELSPPAAIALGRAVLWAWPDYRKA